MVRDDLIERLATVQLVPITAFDGRGNLALEPMEKLASGLIQAGIRVFIPCAGSAEFHSLTRAEIVECISMYRRVCGDTGNRLRRNLDLALSFGRLAPIFSGHCCSSGAKPRAGLSEVRTGRG